MASTNPSDRQELLHMTIALPPELIARIEAARLKMGMRSRSALVRLLLEEILQEGDQSESEPCHSPAS
jgi:metal-responsive CopG/Arc/MetJ family transcriptional regulator